MEAVKVIITVVIAIVLLKLFIDIFMAGAIGLAATDHKLGGPSVHHRRVHHRGHSRGYISHHGGHRYY